MTASPPPFIEWYPQPDGTSRAVINMVIGRGQTLLIDHCRFWLEGTELGSVDVKHGPQFAPRRWWERLLRRSPRPIEAHLMVTSNHFDLGGRTDV